MKALRIIAVSFFLLAFASFAFAQSTSREFISGDGRFAIALDPTPTSRTTAWPAIKNYDLNGESIVWDTGYNYTDVSYFSVYGSGGKLTLADKNKVVAEYKRQWIDTFVAKGIDAKFTESPYLFDGFRGFELKGSVSKNIVMRIFFAKNRLIIIGIVRPKDVGYEEMVSAANTFRYLPQDEYIKALMAENEPRQLPQSGSPAGQPSEAKAKEGLLGKVATVIAEEQVSQNAKRERYSEEYFDKDGYYIRSISYLGGFPDEITNWGWLDGMRVNDSNYISYPLDEGPKAIRGILAAPDSAPEQQVERDERFSEKLTYKYDESGRLIENSSYGNTGKLNSKAIITYENGRRTTIRTYGWDDGTTKLVETLDSAGNVVEEQRFENGKLEDTTVYKYDRFDSDGNWLVRRSFGKKKVRSKVTLVPSSTTFRTITYH